MSHKKFLQNIKKKKEFSCKVCNKSFNRKHNRDVHVLTHDPNNKNFPCKICCNKFFTKDQMNTHYLRRHTNKTPFQCPYCKKKFNAMANCNKHIETACSKRFQKKLAKIKRTN